MPWLSTSQHVGGFVQPLKALQHRTGCVRGALPDTYAPQRTSVVGLEPLQPFQGPRPTTGQAGWCLLLGVRHPVLRVLRSSHRGSGTARRVINTCSSSALQCTCAMCIDRQDCANQPVGRCWRTVQHLERSCSNHLDRRGGVGCRAPWWCLLGVANPVVQSLT